MLVNSKTKQLIQAFISRPTSSLIVEGSDYSAKNHIVQELIAELLKNSHKNNVVRIAPEEGKALGVDAVRELKKSLITKVGGKGIGRVAVIENAQQMTKEAQNSLLKVLEEPTKNTVVVLVTTHSGSLLETIRSRCQTVKALPITRREAGEYAKDNNMPDDGWQRAHTLSGGESELFEALLHNQKTEITDQIDSAKSFLSGSVFSRLAQQKDYAKSESLNSLLAGLTIICEAAMHSTKKDGIQRWKKLLKETKECQSRLSRNAPAKLVYLKLCVNL